MRCRGTRKKGTRTWSGSDFVVVEEQIGWPQNRSSMECGTNHKMSTLRAHTTPTNDTRRGLLHHGLDALDQQWNRLLSFLEDGKRRHLPHSAGIFFFDLDVDIKGREAKEVERKVAVYGRDIQRALPENKHVR